MTHLKIEKLVLYIAILLLVCNALLSRCSKAQDVSTKPNITIVRDTVWQTKVDTFKVQTLTYKTVYVSKKDTSIVDEALNTKDLSQFIEAKKIQRHIK